jgi:hypothetical protein
MEPAKAAPNSTIWSETILWSFSGGVSNRTSASGSLLLEKDVIFGTTTFGPSGSCHDSYGNTFGCGTVFALLP